MSDIHQVLRQVWGYENFRPLQEDIIRSVLEGNDTLALMPTGGGKSLCFQVPALVREGVCIVVTPLIALMKDQVRQLRERNLRAQAVFSGMSRREIDIALDNCVYGDTKFLYLSPERLQTTLFQERLKKMKVGLLAIDEAHCISQWGYDFRPPYLKIAEIRPLIPETPCIALTATATQNVCKDIEEKLDFRDGHRFFRKSFLRPNLSYSCFEEENKPQRLLKVLRAVPGSAVVYVRNRKKTERVAEFLKEKNITADFYHAGLPLKDRSRKQEDWIRNKTRVIVATNAFGMGIDKPDVRLVVHLDIPENLEAYYQEAGRAGRDEKKAYAVLLYQQNDLEELKRQLEVSHPALETIRRVYQVLANRFQIPVGSGELASYDFDLKELTKPFGLKATEVHYSLKRLEEQNLVQLSEALYRPPRLMVLVSREELYKFQVANAAFDPLLKALFRLYGGGELFKTYKQVSEAELSKLANLPPEKVKQQLAYLNQHQFIDYQPQKNKPQLTLLTKRWAESQLPLDVKFMDKREAEARHRAEAISRYVKADRRCRTELILEYFDEILETPCGVCDNCLAARKSTQESREQPDEHLRAEVERLVRERPYATEDLLEQFPPKQEEVILKLVRRLVASGAVKFTEMGELFME